MKPFRDILLVAALLVQACTEPNEALPTPVHQMRFPSKVGAGEAFSVFVQIRDLYCGETGRMVTRVRVDSALWIDVEWRDVVNTGDVCDEPGGDLFFTEVLIDGIPGPVGRTVTLKSGTSTFGSIAVVAEGETRTSIERP